MRAEVLSRPSIQSSRLRVMEEVKPTPNSLLQSLAGGDMSVLDRLYDAHRDDFLRWAGHRFVVKNRDDLLDAWHDTMIMFYEQVRDRKLTHLTCEIKTYLFTIGYRRLLKIFKRNENEDPSVKWRPCPAFILRFKSKAIPGKHLCYKYLLGTC